MSEMEWQVALPTGPVPLSSGVPLPSSHPDVAHQSVPFLALVTPHQAGEPQPRG